MQIHSREELYRYLDNFDYSSKQETELSSVYFLIKYNNIIMPFYFQSFEDIYFESPCELIEYPMEKDNLEYYVKMMYIKDNFEEALKFETLMQREDKHYEIENFQYSELFLPDEIEIIDALTESECLDWLIEHKEK